MKKLTEKKALEHTKMRPGPRTPTGALRRADLYRWLERGSPPVDEVKEWEGQMACQYPAGQQRSNRSFRVKGPDGPPS